MYLCAWILALISVQEIFVKRKKEWLSKYIWFWTFWMLLCCFKLFSVSNIFSPSSRKLTTQMFYSEAIKVWYFELRFYLDMDITMELWSLCCELNIISKLLFFYLLGNCAYWGCKLLDYYYIKSLPCKFSLSIKISIFFLGSTNKRWEKLLSSF